LTNYVESKVGQEKGTCIEWKTRSSCKNHIKERFCNKYGEKEKCIKHKLWKTCTKRKTHKKCIKRKTKKICKYISKCNKTNSKKGECCKYKTIKVYKGEKCKKFKHAKKCTKEFTFKDNHKSSNHKKKNVISQNQFIQLNVQK